MSRDKMLEFLNQRIKDLTVSFEDHKKLSHDEYMFLKGQSDELTTIYKAYLSIKKQED